MAKASERQEGGSHYTDMKIQPAEYAMENDLNYLQANAIKYISRYKAKNGKQDLEKAIHCVELLMEFEYKPRPMDEGDNVFPKYITINETHGKFVWPEHGEPGMKFIAVPEDYETIKSPEGPTSTGVTQ